MKPETLEFIRKMKELAENPDLEYAKPVFEECIKSLEDSAIVEAFENKE